MRQRKRQLNKTKREKVRQRYKVWEREKERKKGYVKHVDGIEGKKEELSKKQVSGVNRKYGYVEREREKKHENIAVFYVDNRERNNINCKCQRDRATKKYIGEY